MAIEQIPIQIKDEISKGRKKSQITNLFLISDIHIGMKMGSEEWIENGREYFEKFLIPLLNEKKDEGSALLCLGDIFDDRKSINLAANDLAIDVFEKLSEILPVYIINGNHDMYNKSDNTITSLRSFDNIPNLTIFKNPTIWSLGDSKWQKRLLMIPYQGDMEKETNIVNQNNTSDYIFLHTDIKNLRYDNGMSISLGVDTSATKAKIYSGHIHKRQESDNMVYVGSPFQLRRSDIGNQKGIYHLNLIDDSRNFYPNNISPVFIKIPLEQIQEANDSEIERIVSHNYVDILTKDSQTQKIKVGELYDRINVFKPKRIEIKVIPDEVEDTDVDYCEERKDEHYQEKTTSQIIECLIDDMENIDENMKSELKELNKVYQKLASIEE